MPSTSLELRAPLAPCAPAILTAEAMRFLAGLERRFGARRRDLLELRAERQHRIDAGELPGFLPGTRAIREGDWQVVPAPADLTDRRVEITGPVDRKMMINALNSGANVYMADFEDSFAPVWAATLQGQQNLLDAARLQISHVAPDGRKYALAGNVATLVVRPRGWHLDEPGATVDGKPMSASLFDAGLFLHHCSRPLLERGTAPYLYLPKMESHLEARLWNEVLDHAEAELGLAPGTIRVTVLIETVLAAFEMDEILHELRTRACGLNAGRWDYIFSLIKKFHHHREFVLPDRHQVTMTAPFLRAYTELLVKTCHRRGAHAIGGMAAYVPNRQDAAANERALGKVREDKLREAADGFDGTWVAHPDLVPVARAVFDARLGQRPNQLDRRRDEVQVTPRDLLHVHVPKAKPTHAGLRHNAAVALRYLDHWLRGAGAVVLYDLMEDTATAEIARAQVWQWVRHHVPLEDWTIVTPELVLRVVDAETAAAKEEAEAAGRSHHRLDDARQLFLDLVVGDPFTDFLTLAATPRPATA
ncbi:MAG TPA: malate synthase A [Candidatus Thermoplasmatota archaeon]|nr:malate synthase A [Candidatus Thermoplasmatota archaeon]